MNCLDVNVALQEVPDEISLSFLITGCPVKCEDCHTKICWDANNGSLLTDDDFIAHLNKYKGLVSCVLFYGGEWDKEALISKLKIAQNKGLLTCLYTGKTEVDNDILAHLSLLKTGPWIPNKGTLKNKNTNQIFTDLRTNEKLNYKFHQE